VLVILYGLFLLEPGRNNKVQVVPIPRKSKKKNQVFNHFPIELKFNFRFIRKSLIQTPFRYD